MPEITTSFSSKVFYRKMGAGPVAVLLHGFPESGTLWRNIWDHLAAFYTLLIPDLPGAGESQLTGPISIAQMAEAVKMILDSEQVEQAVVIGHSMGGYVAFAFADLYPQYVAGLTLVHSTPFADDEEKKETRKKVIDIVNKGGKDAFLKTMVPGLFAEEFVKTNQAAVAEQVDNALIMSKEAVINFYAAMMERKERKSVLAKSSFPVQWIIGAKDALIPAKKLMPLTHMSAVNFTSYYKDCGHMSMVEAPAQLQKDIKEFLDYCYSQ
ncbi:alpha/beta hydrolase [Flavipsychrobacter stenotrophus]|uniref:Alpha/beta hydrolase n=1 Tax=Flavipsychrobacter stenotrophus TaxID=2077091 RepID=A0A2S7T287_9BACT|nr:alpha/beta hydrolase [Flavipsychrobacter stenotrophus]PQJ12905.1 alpha/beta hydrolase [Flavipsychrobacter stenotrophus]